MSAGFVRLKPNAARRWSEIAFMLTRPVAAVSHAPRLPTYAASTTRFFITSRWTLMFH
jgi:hypothetical protein